MKKRYTTTIPVRTDEKLRSDLEYFADMDNRKLADYIRQVLLRHVAEIRAEQKCGDD